MTMTEGPKIAALSCGKPVYLVVLLHGEGADGAAIIDQALNWAPTLPKADFVAVEAPLAGPDGGRSWFTEDGVNGGLETAAAALDSFLDVALAQRRLPDSHLALVGFSQGAALALATALRRPSPMAAVIAFSGALPESLPLSLGTSTPVLLIHGEADEQVPFAHMQATKERLKSAGVPVKSMRRPGLGHSMDDDGVLAAGDFLTAQIMALAAQRSAASTEAHG